MSLWLFVPVCLCSDGQTSHSEASSADHSDVLAGSHHVHHSHRPLLLLDVPTPHTGLPTCAGAHTGETCSAFFFCGVCTQLAECVCFTFLVPQRLLSPRDEANSYLLVADSVEQRHKVNSAHTLNLTLLQIHSLIRPSVLRQVFPKFGQILYVPHFRIYNVLFMARDGLGQKIDPGQPTTYDHAHVLNTTMIVCTLDLILSETGLTITVSAPVQADYVRSQRPVVYLV